MSAQYSGSNIQPVFDAKNVSQDPFEIEEECFQNNFQEPQTVLKPVVERPLTGKRIRVGEIIPDSVAVQIKPAIKAHHNPNVCSRCLKRMKNDIDDFNEIVGGDMDMPRMVDHLTQMRLY